MPCPGNERVIPASRRLALAAVFSSSLGLGLIFDFQPPLIALVLGRGGSSNFAIGAVTAAGLIAMMALGPAASSPDLTWRHSRLSQDVD
jgi:hypothetical protein